MSRGIVTRIVLLASLSLAPAVASSRRYSLSSRRASGDDRSVPFTSLGALTARDCTEFEMFFLDDGERRDQVAEKKWLDFAETTLGETVSFAAAVVAEQSNRDGRAPARNAIDLAISSLFM